MDISYEVECPKCNTPYVKYIKSDLDEYEMTCEECGTLFSVSAEVGVFVIAEEKRLGIQGTSAMEP